MAKTKTQEPPVQPMPEQEAPPKVRKEGNPLLTILTILLVLVGVGELGLLGYYGFSVFQHNMALREYEEEQESREEQQESRKTATGSSYGPTLKVENGTVTWRWEDDRPTGSALSGGNALSGGSTGQSQNSGEKRLSRFTVPEIPYVLADMGEDTETRTPAQRTGPLTDGVSTAT